MGISHLRFSHIRTASPFILCLVCILYLFAIYRNSTYVPTVSLRNPSHRNVLKEIEKVSNEEPQEPHKDLSSLMQARLYALQNPADCNSARKLVCRSTNPCGIGCQIHQDVFCFILAYITGRMLVLQNKEWHVYNVPFEELFLPLSDTCTNPVVLSDKQPHSGMSDPLVVKVTDFTVSGLDEDILGFLPPSIPSDIAERILRLQDDPIVWWISQFIMFLLRPQPKLTSMLKAAESGLDHPYVGVHIRRGDKLLSEAASHSVEEYMKHVDKFYQELAISEGLDAPVKRVFLSSDDPNVLKECREKYPQYVFFFNDTVTKDAYHYSSATLPGILTDIHMLSRADFLVCTFSSNVCRLAYEMLQQTHTDAASRIVSLDHVWYFHGQGVQQWEAVVAHEGEGEEEINLMVGDVVENLEFSFSQMTKGRNDRTGKVGLFPGYKIKKIVKIVDFPTYPEVNTKL